MKDVKNVLELVKPIKIQKSLQDKYQKITEKIKEVQNKFETTESDYPPPVTETIIDSKESKMEAKKQK